MITSLFRKSTPLNYSILILAVLVFFFLFQVQQTNVNYTATVIIEKLLIIVVLFASLFVVNFIVKKNGLSRDSSYTVLFYLLLLLFIPDVFADFNVLASNFFILLAFRRLVSLQSLKASKEKIFDASLWIFVAALFHFWSILFIVLVFISIIVHAARDYRNWLLPFIAGFAVSVTFLLFALIFDPSRISRILETSHIDLKIDYFTNNYQNLALSLYATLALFFLVAMFISLSSRPLMLHSSYKKMIWFFVIGAVIYLISPEKSNVLLLFTFAPIAMMATSQIEITQKIWQKEVVIAAVIICGFVTFFSQL